VNIELIEVVAVPFARSLIRLILLAGVVAGPAAAQEPETPQAGLPPPDSKAYASLQAFETELDRLPNTVVADVGPHAVTWGDIADALRSMPPIAGGLSYPVLYQRAVMQLIQQEAVVLQAETIGLDKDPVVRRRMRAASEQALATEMLRRSLLPNLSDKAVRSTYDALVANKPGPDEVRARLIMVDTPTEAEALIGRLRQGADFATLAKQYSKDGTAPHGGDLGFARLDMVTPELGAVMFALAPGQMTQYPVKVHNAWFVVFVEERRQPAAPSFEQARAALEQDIVHAGAPVLAQEALKAAPVHYHGMAGSGTEKAP
jgi:peptidyl-prolyl cis-trans isomerase C